MHLLLYVIFLSTANQYKNLKSFWCCFATGASFDLATSMQKNSDEDDNFSTMRYDDHPYEVTGGVCTY